MAVVRLLATRAFLPPPAQGNFFVILDLEMAAPRPETPGEALSTTDTS